MPFVTINTALPTCLIFGQSNCLPQAATGDSGGSVYNFNHPGILWRYTETSGGLVNGGVGDFGWLRRPLTGLSAPGTTRFGLERTFGELAGCHVINVCKGGTKLNGNWLPAQSEHVTLVAQVDAALAAAGRSTLDFAVWLQGEGDTNVEADSLAYEANLGTLFTDVRTRWGAGLPVFLPYLHDNNTGTYEANVRTAQETYAAGDANCHGYDPDALGYTAAHFTTQGLADLGAGLAALAVSSGVLPV